jgi:hypothetical protein
MPDWSSGLVPGAGEVAVDRVLDTAAKIRRKDSMCFLPYIAYRAKGHSSQSGEMLYSARHSENSPAKKVFVGQACVVFRLMFGSGADIDEAALRLYSPSMDRHQ